MQLVNIDLRIVLRRPSESSFRTNGPNMDLCVKEFKRSKLSYKISKISDRILPPFLSSNSFPSVVRSQVEKTVRETIKELATLNQIFNIEEKEVRARSGLEKFVPFSLKRQGTKEELVVYCVARQQASRVYDESINSRLSRVFLKEA